MELAVLADFLRRRVTELEHLDGTAGDLDGESVTVGRMRADLRAARTNLKESQARQYGLEEEIAEFEAELADDRELLNMAAQQSGIGVAEAIRRNKKLKSTLRERELEIEKCRDELSVNFC